MLLEIPEGFEGVPVGFGEGDVLAGMLSDVILFLRKYNGNSLQVPGLKMQCRVQITQYIHTYRAVD